MTPERPEPETHKVYSALLIQRIILLLCTLQDDLSRREWPE